MSQFDQECGVPLHFYYTPSGSVRQLKRRQSDEDLLLIEERPFAKRPLYDTSTEVAAVAAPVVPIATFNGAIFNGAAPVFESSACFPEPTAVGGMATAAFPHVSAAVVPSPQYVVMGSGHYSAGVVAIPPDVPSASHMEMQHQDEGESAARRVGAGFCADVDFEADAVNAADVAMDIAECPLVASIAADVRAQQPVAPVVPLRRNIEDIIEYSSVSASVSASCHCGCSSGHHHTSFASAKDYTWDPMDPRWNM